jgi:hypothetical protein
VPLIHNEAPGGIVIPGRVAIYSYSNIQHAIVSSITLALGDNILLSAAVPANTLHVYTNLCMAYIGTVLNVVIHCTILSGAVYYYLFSQSPVVSAVRYDRQGLWVLKAGDQLAIVITGATLNDDAYLWANGHAVSLV